MRATPAELDDGRSGPGEVHDRPTATEVGNSAGHGTLRGYLIGFGLSVGLTAIPFWLVMGNVLGSSNNTVLAITALAAVQIVVHMVFFLHMNTKSEGGWTMLALIFTAVLVVITLSGSLWIMYHLNTNMMPTHGHHSPLAQ